MELLLEFIFDLVVEGSAELVKSKKVSKWIRYPLSFILVTFILSIIFLIGFVGISMIKSNDTYTLYGGILLIIFDIILIVSGIRKIIIIKKGNDNNE